ncbi:23S rRNA (adenine(1618)-N(6))-methyltransferase RlmF [Alteromonas sp. 5E99-2]|uniref:23S rRNA (adenine(1618)-N(6))-methyltransferase RlmF n=1 Tax=Alteromonas sp. 5E99-2 TaxID=2817683 RepID=UPI001A9907C7|nr:23S rRNA (adenine(1618)-N(6))-methyltransferase RlmF [Alteromonas sp. 5E99-2]MBO1255856.1 23S rRNA (adenine(1618)-N(6))-methyltransferase RlmF [Alteromonas sp. 5E99-2]
MNAKKNQLHPRNAHVGHYPLAQLVACYSPLKKFIVSKPDNTKTINFSLPDAVKALNTALLHHYYGVTFWDIPEGYLCPAIPGRADYVHYIADLLAHDHGGKIPKGKQIKGLDVGTGANLVYPIIGVSSYDWKFVGADIDPVSVKSASAIASNNTCLKSNVVIRKQSNKNHLFKGIVKPEDKFDFCMCNPPFHKSAQDAAEGTKRKVRNLSKNANKRQSSIASKEKVGLNFKGQSNELWCDGGEFSFINKMIKESLEFKDQVIWFTSLVSKSEHLPRLKKSLSQIGVSESKIINMAQGQKISRFIAWRF